MKKKEIVLSMAVVLMSLGLIISEVMAVDTTRSTFKVENLSCGSCLSKISYELKGYEGMVGMDADLWKGLVMVDHQEPLSGEEIASVITNLGYPATLLDEAEVAELNQDPQDQAQTQNNAGYGGCGGCGSRGGGGCGGSSSAWKQFYQKYRGNNNAPQNNQ